MLRSSMTAAAFVLLAATPSLADALTPSKEAVARAASERDRRDGVRPPLPPSCDDAKFCDLTKPFRFKGGMSF